MLIGIGLSGRTGPVVVSVAVVPPHQRVHLLCRHAVLVNVLVGVVVVVIVVG